MTGYLDEAQVETVTVNYSHESGYEYVHGPVIAPDGGVDYEQITGLIVRERHATLF